MVKGWDHGMIDTRNENYGISYLNKILNSFKIVN